MSHATDTATSGWTAFDLADRFGPIPLARVRLQPEPGSATERDVVEIHDREDRLFELVDGILLEKTMGTYEAYLAVVLVHRLSTFLDQHNLGIVLGTDGMMRLAPGLVRIPDVSFISWQRLPDRKVPRTAMAELAPDLAVEVISPSNTVREMQRKLRDYFTAGVRSVWYVYPTEREVHVFESPDPPRVLRVADTLHDDRVLPGFVLDLQQLFAEPGAGS